VDLSLAPGDTTLFHEHTADIVTLLLEPGDTTNQVLSGEPTRSPARQAGQVGYAAYATKPYTHRVSNVGQSTFRIIGVEIFSPRGLDTKDLAGRDPPFELVLENDRVRVWKMALESGQTVGPISRPMPSVQIVQAGGRLLIQGEGSSVETNAKAGDLRWWPKGTSSSLRNVGSSQLVLVDIEVK
jgi:quercetin dioxygenase-like cupin family protein